MCCKQLIPPCNNRVRKCRAHNGAPAAMCVNAKVKTACIKHKVMALQRLDPVSSRLRDRSDDNNGADSSIHRPLVLCQDPDVRRLKVWSDQKDIK